MRINLLLLFAGISHFSYAQTRVSIDSVGQYIGQKITVCSEVYGVKSNDKITFINLAKAYPHSPLTIVILAKDRANFSDSPEKLYGNKPICVTGVIKDYNGKIEIVVTSPDEITADQ